MLILIWIWNSYPFRSRSKGLQIWPYGQTLSLPRRLPEAWLPFTTRPIRCHRRVRQVCFIGATPSSSLAACLKTSFSRSNPVPRGQATVIRPLIRGNPKATNNKRSRATSFLPTSNPSPISGRLGLQRVHRERARTWVKPTPGSLQINLLFTILQNRHRAYHQVQTYFFFKGYLHRHLDTKLYWWS